MRKYPSTCHPLNIQEIHISKKAADQRERSETPTSQITLSNEFYLPNADEYAKEADIHVDLTDAYEKFKEDNPDISIRDSGIISKRIHAPVPILSMSLGAGGKPTQSNPKTPTKDIKEIIEEHKEHYGKGMNHL